MTAVGLVIVSALLGTRIERAFSDDPISEQVAKFGDVMQMVQQRYARSPLIFSEQCAMWLLFGMLAS